ncbi:hypothetical protein PIB30_059843 [Stylosanthes scabra]|uniref:Uncharacterized protein n=1 Tax=Stylosanthes scabra TaxID=79078 RepID=A0ABU6XLW5_9FABA|nr:hypothetical protein [Stylosanthes scabra]
MAGRGAGKGTGRGRGTSSPSTSSHSTSAMPGSTQVTSSPSPYLVVLNPEYQGPPPPPPPPIPPTIPSRTPPPPPVDLTTPAPPAQQDVGYTQEPSEPTVPESSHGPQPDPTIQSNAKKKIRPNSIRGFLPKHNNCTQEITSVIKLMYAEAWPNWKAIPAATRDRMFEKWAEKFTWEKDDDDLIKAIFKTRASKRFSRMMEDVREGKEHLTQWCRPELKKLLYHY